MCLTLSGENSHPDDGIAGKVRFALAPTTRFDDDSPREPYSAFPFENRSEGIGTMSLAFNTLYAAKAKGTHHKLALDALRLMRRHDAEDWHKVFLSEIDLFLKGSKAPDDEFQDFKNHVLHVGESEWGGAIVTAREWYAKTKQALAKRDWREAVYSAGVLSHYVTDPFMPLHTGQSEREGSVHRPLEWSVSKSYDALRTLLEKELGGYPEPKLATGEDWLDRLIRDGAKESHVHYETLLDHYNLELGVKDPPAGLDRESREIIARCLGRAAMSFSRVIDRVITEAGVLVPHTTVSLQAMLQSAAIPLKFITSKMSDFKERAQVEAMYLEFRKTGKVVETLPIDDRTVRALHCQEVRKISLAELDRLPAESIGTKFSGPIRPVRAVKAPPPSPAPPAESKKKNEPVAPADVPQPKAILKRDDLTAPRLAPRPANERKEKPESEERTSAGRISASSPLADAPSIGPKTAERFAAINIRTIGEFLNADADRSAPRLKTGHITPDLFRQWQDQARLVLGVPSLKGHDAQILTGIEIATPEELASADARELYELVAEFCESSAGKRVLRDSSPPDLAEVGQWIAAAKKTRVARAA